LSLGERGEGLLEISVRILDGLAGEMTRYRDGQDYGEPNTRISLVITFELQVGDTDNISQRSHQGSNFFNRRGAKHDVHPRTSNLWT
jgi:hypothetical protein